MKKHWQGRIDSVHDISLLRWHQVVEECSIDKIDLKVTEMNTNNFGFLGFACDEGVRRNQGRVGAKAGPEFLRKAMASFPVHFDTNQTKLYDVGDVSCDDSNLEKSQGTLAKRVSTLLDKNIFPIVLGGGHEVAYGHYLGIMRSKKFRDKKVGIINFDAHFDLRSYENGASSGSPFLQIADECKANGKSFSYMCLGIQKHANTKSLFETAKELNATYKFKEEVVEDVKGTHLALEKFLESVDVVYLTICLDVFQAAIAPGVSASQPNGLSVDNVLPLIKSIMVSKKVISCDIAELSPRYDTDSQTSKLAGFLIFEIVDQLLR